MARNLVLLLPRFITHQRLRLKVHTCVPLLSFLYPNLTCFVSSLTLYLQNDFQNVLFLKRENVLCGFVGSDLSICKFIRIVRLSILGSPHTCRSWNHLGVLVLIYCSYHPFTLWPHYPFLTITSLANSIYFKHGQIRIKHNKPLKLHINVRSLSTTHVERENIKELKVVFG